MGGTAGLLASKQAAEEKRLGASGDAVTVTLAG